MSIARAVGAIGVAASGNGLNWKTKRQTMKLVSDRKRLRWEYLRRRIRVYRKGATGGFLIVCALLLLCALLSGYRYVPTLWHQSIDSTGRMHGKTIGFNLELLCLVTIITGVFVRRLTQRGTRLIRQAKQEARLIDPEVDTLPAEEILVRGSEEPPVVQSEVLLRAAKEQETPKEELLRVSQE